MLNTQATPRQFARMDLSEVQEEVEYIMQKRQPALDRAHWADRNPDFGPGAPRVTRGGREEARVGREEIREGRSEESQER